MWQFSLTRSGIRDCVFVLLDNNNGVGRFSLSILYLAILILIKQYYKQLSIAQNFIAELTQLVASFVAYYSNFDIDLKYLAQNLYLMSLISHFAPLSSISLTISRSLRFYISSQIYLLHYSILTQQSNTKNMSLNKFTLYIEPSSSESTMDDATEDEALASIRLYLCSIRQIMTTVFGDVQMSRILVSKITCRDHITVNLDGFT